MPSTILAETESRLRRAPITVLVVAVDRPSPAHLESALRSDPRLEVRTAATIASMLEQLDTADCLVLVASASSATGASDEETTTADEETTTADEETTTNANANATAADSLERIRSHVLDLPIVVASVGDCDGRCGPPIDSTGRAPRWTVHVFVPADGTAADGERVARRVRQLVERRRLSARFERSLAGLELAGEPIAIVDPDGALEFANRRFAMQFGYDRAALQEVSWRTWFADETVARLESTAIPTVTDGWQWTGRCTARRQSGESFPARVRLGGLEDGSLVFVVTELEGGDDGDAATVTETDDAGADETGAGDTNQSPDDS